MAHLSVGIVVNVVTCGMGGLECIDCVLGGSFGVLRVRGLNSGVNSVHGDSVSPCLVVCQPRLNGRGIGY